MSLIAQFKDGEFMTKTASTESLSKSKEKNSSGIDSDAFLTLLVAEMQNQDPLEPTSNTEWISQYATFTEVSEIQEIGNDMQSVKAQDLVGEHVIMKVTSSSGNTDYVTGQVDYVTYEEGKAYLSINGSLYSIDDLDTVASTQYMDAYSLASDVADLYKKLPQLDLVTMADKENIETLVDKTSKMNDYEKSFLDKSIFEAIDSYDKKIKEVIAKNNNDAADDSSDSANDDASDNTKKEDI